MRRKIWHLKITRFTICLALTILISIPGLLSARLKEDAGARELRELRGYLKPTDIPVPNVQSRVHKVGNVLMCVTNYGFFGSKIDEGVIDPETNELAPSCEFPAGSGIEYLFQGALWIGAIVDEDTLVSVGADGWQWINEMYPDAIPRGDMEKRSIRPNDPAYSPDAVSEADYIAVYTDTLTDPAYVAQDPMDRRPHKPLNVRILQKSYSWSYKYAEDFILFDFLIYNIGQKSLRRIYIGIYIDADVLQPDVNTEGFSDDIAGFKETYTRESDGLEDSIRIAWIADNDGDPTAGNASFDRNSPVGVTGTRVVRTPNPDLKYSFNWWVSEQYDPAKYDWGPMMRANYRDFGTGGLGTPEGDKNKYYILSNNEFDYDQIWAAVNMSDSGWLDPPAADLASKLAHGYDTRYLISFGPFNLEPGDSLPITLAYVAGDNFHVKPADFANNFDMNNPQKFYNTLDFSDLGLNATWAAWVYDNPGVDTDGDGDSGKCRPVVDTVIQGEDTSYVEDCIYYEGDGVPDFTGPPPPPAPILRYSTIPGKVTIQWNGLNTETYFDNFSGKQDFEGYRVYMGREAKLDAFSLLTSNDKIDYNMYRWDVGKSKWFLTGVPLTVDEINATFDETVDPTVYIEDNPYTASNGSRYYFDKVDWNQWFSDPHGIKKIYQAEIDAGVVTPDTGVLEYPQNYVTTDSVTYYHKYYEYEYSIDNLIASQPLFFSVTAFDYGNPENGLEPLESSPLSNVVKVYPIYSADQVVENDAKVSVYPNPYRVDAGYAKDRFEDPGGTGRADWERRIHFINLPAECTIKIWTLDGDLVREIQHPDPMFSETNSSAYWDLITRNTQAVVSGIYVYSIESDQGTQLGKIVIIK